MVSATMTIRRCAPSLVASGNFASSAANATPFGLSIPYTERASLRGVCQQASQWAARECVWVAISRKESNMQKRWVIVSVLVVACAGADPEGLSEQQEALGGGDLSVDFSG